MDNPQESNGVQLSDEVQEPACPQEQDSMHQSNQTQTPDSTIRNVPWGLWDAFLIAMVFFFAPCLLLTLILFLPQGHLFFLPNIENEPAIIWSSPKPQSAQSQTAPDKDGICQEELVLEFAEGTPCSHDTPSDSSVPKTTNASQVEMTKKNRPNHADGPSSDTDTDSETDTETDLKTEHPLTQLLVQAKGTSRYWWSVLFAFLAGVVAAPIVEEFLFRVVLQGALERKPDKEFSDGAARRRTAIAILVPAFFFASIHYRTPGTQQDLDLLFSLHADYSIWPVGNSCFRYWVAEDSTRSNATRFWHCLERTSNRFSQRIFGFFLAHSHSGSGCIPGSTLISRRGNRSDSHFYSCSRTGYFISQDSPLRLGCWNALCSEFL